MSKKTGWIVFAKRQSGGYVVEDTKYLFLGTAEQASFRAAKMMEDFNRIPNNNPIVKAWAQECGLDDMPEMVEPTDFS